MNSNWSYSPETPNLGQNRRFFLSSVTLKFDRWPWKRIGQLFYAASNYVHHVVTICEFKLQLSSGNPQIGTKFVLISVTLTFDLWPWPFAWTTRLSMVIISGWYDDRNIVKRCDERTDRRTDGQGERSVVRVAWLQLKCIIRSLVGHGGERLVTLLWQCETFASEKLVHCQSLSYWHKV